MAVVLADGADEPDEPEPFPLDGIVGPPPPPPLHAANMAIAHTAKKERIGRLLSIIPPVKRQIRVRQLGWWLPPSAYTRYLPWYSQ
jgi:hypothetical protein